MEKDCFDYLLITFLFEGKIVVEWKGIAFWDNIKGENKFRKVLYKRFDLFTSEYCEETG